ncbi:MAG: Kelch repeat-containing protein, partial [Polyangiaceae bacterium]
WTATATMTYARTHHGAGLLPSGKVLVGGGTQTEPSLSSEIWDPTTGTWALTGTFNVARGGSPVFTRLSNDKLLVAGTTHTASTGETYDELTGNWTLTGSLVSARGNVTPVLLDSGKVLLAGGFYPNDHFNAETYDPTTNQWSAAGTLTEGRYLNAVVKLSNGRVLVAGGYRFQASSATATAEVYNPFFNTWAQVKSMNHARAEFSAILLPSGKVLVAGGRDDAQVPAVLNSAEIYDPQADTWTDVGNIANRVASYRLALMDDGKVALFGGWISGPTTNAVQFFTEANGWTSTTPMIWPRDNHTATRLNDGRWLITGGGNILNTAEVYGIVAQGGTCTLDNECATDHCVDGYCCDTACTGTCSSCSAAIKGSGANGVCGAIAAQTDPDKECGSCSICSGSGSCGPVTAGTDPKNNCKDSGSPNCGLDGTCDGAGACRSYSTNAGCSPRPCTLGSDCESGFCADGVCCDQACNGQCMACLAAKKGTGVDGQCGPIAADSDPDNECAEGPNYPTSCLADGQCDGQGACRQFAKQTVACGDTQCTGNSAVGLLCNGAGTCGQAVAYCDPYKCDQGTCQSACQTNNDCTADAFCTSLNTCEKKLAAGSACTTGQECESNFCVDGVCCDSACNGQCEACNVAPNLGACVPVNGAPVGTRTQCNTSDTDCAGSCDGVDRAACSYPGSEIRCGTPSCESGIAHSSFCNAKGVCVADDDQPCGAYACGDTKCKTTCATAGDCASGYTCSDQGTCVPGATCSDDLTTSNGVSGERTCAPFLCDPGSGNCLQLCSTSSECVSGFVCDTAIKACIAASGAGASADDSGCGCRLPGAPTQGPARWLLFGLGFALVRARRRAKLRARAKAN